VAAVAQVGAADAAAMEAEDAGTRKRRLPWQATHSGSASTADLRLAHLVSFTRSTLIKFA
jgi:hypothetical protein